MTQDNKKKKPTNSLIKKSVLIFIGLFLLYVIVGFWVVPPLLKPRLEKELSRQIGRKVTIEIIKINPLTLSSLTRNLTIYEIDGEPFAGFKEFLVDVELSSLIKWAVTFKEIRLLEPFATLKVLPDQTLNISDILSQLGSPESSSKQQAELPRAVISELEIENGKFTVEDLSETEPALETIFPISFTLTNLSTLADQEGAFRFTGASQKGGNYQLDGQLSINPVRVQGSYSATGINLSQLWKHIADQVSFQIKHGTSDLSGNYLVELIDGRLNAKLQDGNFELKDFQLTEKGENKVLVSIPSFSAQGISADVRAQKIVVEQLKTADGNIESWLATDGTFKLTSLFIPHLQKLQEMKTASSTEPKKVSGSPWYVSIHKIEVNRWSAVIEDQTLSEPARISVDNLTVKIEDLENKKNSKAKVALSLQINQGGTVKINGLIGIAPLSAEMEVLSDKITLKPFQAYVDTAINAQIISGTTSSRGSLLYRGQGGQPQIRYQGELSLDGVRVKDRLQTEDFVKLEQLKVGGVVLDLSPNKLNVADVLINKLQAGVTIDQNGTVNVVQVFTPIPVKSEKERKNLLEQLVNFLILQIKGSVPMNINLVKLDDLSVDFFDRSITPSYKTHLEINQGTMSGLSSEPEKLANFKIEGTIDQSATIKSSGLVNPLNSMQHVKVDFSLSDFKLQPVSPYTGKYIGYGISEGSLHLDLKYRVDDSMLIGDNRIFVDQLTLGDKVESPDAIHLPVALGVAILKDKNGDIKLQVPISGDVKNPKFNFGKIIVSALTKTMTNVTRSPFSSVTDLGGFKGEELRFVEFKSGLPEFNTKAPKKLVVLAKFLNERPALTLNIEGSADRQVDWAIMSGKQAKDQVVDDSQLIKLAQKRANIVKDYLVQKGKVPVKRVQLKPVKIISTVNKEHVSVELYLSAH